MGRFLGVNNYGIYSFAIAIGNILVVFLNMGARNYVTREIIHNPNSLEKFLGSIFLIRFFFISLLEVFLYFYLKLNKSDNATSIITFIVVNTIFLNSFMLIYYALYRAHEIYKVEILTESIINILTVIGYYFILKNGYGLFGIVLFLFLMTITQNIVIGYKSFRITKLSIQTLIQNARFQSAIKIFNETLPFLLTSVFSIIYFRIGTIMLKIYYSNHEVGLYSGAYKLLEMSSYLPDTIVYILFPILIKQAMASKQNLIFYYHKVFKFFLLFVLPFSLGLYFYSSQIINIIWGSKFYQAADSLKILSIAIVFLFLNYILSNLVVALKKEKLLTLNTFITAGINICANLYFIPKYREQGAAITNVISEGIFFIINFIIISKYLTIKPISFQELGKILLINVIFFLCLSKFFIPSIYYGPIIFFIIYGCLILLFKVLDKSDYQLLKLR